MMSLMILVRDTTQSSPRILDASDHPHTKMKPSLRAKWICGIVKQSISFKWKYLRKQKPQKTMGMLCVPSTLGWHLEDYKELCR